MIFLTLVTSVLSPVSGKQGAISKHLLIKHPNQTGYAKYLTKTKAGRSAA